MRNAGVALNMALRPPLGQFACPKLCHDVLIMCPNSARDVPVVVAGASSHMVLPTPLICVLLPLTTRGNAVPIPIVCVAWGAWDGLCQIDLGRLW